jgi:hypothetical protein
MTQIYIETTYVGTTSMPVGLPEGKTWEDIEWWTVKWHNFECRFKDGVEFSMDLGAVELDCIDTKRPAQTQVYACEDENPNYDRMLADDVA